MIEEMKYNLPSNKIDKSFRIELSENHINKSTLRSLREIQNREIERIKTDEYIRDKYLFKLSDIKRFIDKGLLSDNLINGRVYIPNSEYELSVWDIIGINHDGTTDTIDLRTSTIALENIYFDDSVNKSNIYEDSSIRRYLNDTFYNGFCPQAKDMIQTMDVSSNGKILKDKVKLLSMTELGMDDYYEDNLLKGEGNPYNITTHFFNEDKFNAFHMTRSRCTNSNHIWTFCGYGHISDNGSNRTNLLYNFIDHVDDIDEYIDEYGCCIVPVIRLGYGSQIIYY